MIKKIQAETSVAVLHEETDSMELFPNKSLNKETNEQEKK